MISNRHVLMTPLLACAAASLTSVGCGASTAALRAPVEPSSVDAMAGLLGGQCTIEGEPRVMATKVAPRAGINAQADASRVFLRFSPQRSALGIALAVDPQSLDVVDGAESEGPRFVEGSGVGESVEASRVVWQTPAFEAARAERSEPAGDLRTAGPVVARVDAHRWVSAWTTGSIDSGMDVRIQTVDRHGLPIGASTALSSDGRAFGRPTIAVGPSGRGVVAFLQSGDHGFDVVAFAIDCHVPATPDTAAAWAMQTTP